MYHSPSLATMWSFRMVAFWKVSFQSQAFHLIWKRISEGILKGVKSGQFLIYLLWLELFLSGDWLDEFLKSVSNNVTVWSMECLHLFVFWDGRESLGIAPRDEINGNNNTSEIWSPQTLAVKSQDLKFQETYQSVLLPYNSAGRKAEMPPSGASFDGDYCTVQTCL